ncbi:hypothetical protein DdX_18142 [Ditylenchus destructor]|uniref:Uncharacterized protein n=1 Tax=Ditylenchus destructor TaxID=166010 RepID=A0AAD4MQ36_9BILA|nr:hypothetical protein DdX_18142 [Ditylenchus destructor]
MRRNLSDDIFRDSLCFLTVFELFAFQITCKLAQSIIEAMFRNDRYINLSGVYYDKNWTLVSRKRRGAGRQYPRLLSIDEDQSKDFVRLLQKKFVRTNILQMTFYAEQSDYGFSDEMYERFQSMKHIWTNKIVEIHGKRGLFLFLVNRHLFGDVSFLDGLHKTAQ